MNKRYWKDEAKDAAGPVYPLAGRRAPGANELDDLGA
jgi:hypothetical protein